MSTWILIYMLINTDSAVSGSIEFASQGACVMAVGEMYRQKYSHPDWAICVPKGDTK